MKHGLHLQPWCFAEKGVANGVENRRRAQAQAGRASGDRLFYAKCARAQPLVGVLRGVPAGMGCGENGTGRLNPGVRLFPTNNKNQDTPGPDTTSNMPSFLGGLRFLFQSLPEFLANYINAEYEGMKVVNDDGKLFGYFLVFHGEMFLSPGGSDRRNPQT